MELIRDILREFGLVSVASLLGFACALLVTYYKKHERILKERIEGLKDQVELHKSMSVMDFVDRTKAYKQFAEEEVRRAESTLAGLQKRLEKDNDETNRYFDEAQKLKDDVRRLQDQVAESQRIIQELSRENNLAVGNEFVLAAGTFRYSGKQYVAGVVNGIHMHFAVDHVKDVLAGVSTNPNALYRNFPTLTNMFSLSAQRVASSLRSLKKKCRLFRTKLGISMHNKVVNGTPVVPPL